MIDRSVNLCLLKNPIVEWLWSWRGSGNVMLMMVSVPQPTDLVHTIASSVGIHYYVITWLMVSVLPRPPFYFLGVARLSYILAGRMAFSRAWCRCVVWENKLALISVHVFRLLAQRYKGHLDIYRDISGYGAWIPNRAVRMGGIKGGSIG